MYFCPDLNNSEIQIPSEEAHHIVHVVRKQSGDEVLLTNGRGESAKATLTKTSAKDCRAVIKERFVIPSPTNILHLAFAPTKNIDRTEWMLEKATEMGVMYFTPLRCRHSERKEINPERLTKILVSAAKQSQRVWFPQLHPVTPFLDFISASKGERFIAHCNPSIKREPWQTYLDAGMNRTVMIGPEGDFSTEEVEAAINLGFSGLDLGNRRLRTETAAMAVCLPLLFQQENN